MKLSSIRIENFRSFSDETISFGEYTCFVGPNGAGKSSVLGALNVVFRNSDSPFEVTYLTEEDFHHKDTSKPIRITVTFSELSAQAREDLKAYVRHGMLVVGAVAEWNADVERAEVKQVGSRLVMKDFIPFFEALDRSALAPELKALYAEAKSEAPELPDARSKDAMSSALREFEEMHAERCELVESGDQFYGWSKGKNLLERHFQWIYVPAVKNPADEQDESKGSALGKLLQRTIRSRVDFSEPVASLRSETAEKYKTLLTAEESVLTNVGESLERRLQEWSHPSARVKLIWKYDDQKSVRIEEPMARVKVGEGDFLGDLVRLGHGVQRSFLVALLQELIGSDDQSAPTLCIAIEEPELYQHPPQARHFAEVLEEHANKGAQVVLTTHSPYFVSGQGFENVRLTRKHRASDESRVTQLTHEQLAKAIAAALGSASISPSVSMAAIEQILEPSLNELFFSRLPVFVEGREDIALISSQLRLSGKWPEFRRYGCHFITCGGKTNMSRPVAIASGLSLPFFCVFDGDANRCTKEEDRKNHERDNACIMKLCGHSPISIPTEDIWGANIVVWKDQILGTVLSDIGNNTWTDAEDSARKRNGLIGGVQRKNPILIAATLEELFQSGIRSQSLDRLCENILSFAASIQGD